MINERAWSECPCSHEPVLTWVRTGLCLNWWISCNISRPMSSISKVWAWVSRTDSRPHQVWPSSCNPRLMMCGCWACRTSFITASDNVRDVNTLESICEAPLDDLLPRGGNWKMMWILNGRSRFAFRHLHFIILVLQFCFTSCTSVGVA